MNQNFKLGIIGGGFCGSATYLLNSNKIECIVYDLDKTKCRPNNTSFNDILQTEAVFICVPTPMTLAEKDYGKCSTNYVTSVVNQLREANYKGYIICRSTVPVGYCDSQNIHFFPEFLTESNWENDFINCKLWIFGISSFTTEEETNKLKNWFQELINVSLVKNKNCEFVTTKEGESVKYFRNCFLATKVSFCNEFYQFCKASNVDYEIVRKCATNDTRIGSSHTLVPCNGKLGYGLSCLPKDISSLKYQMKEKGVESIIISASEERNTTIDRPEKDWMLDIGRATI
jgi:UDPglucose 6-dehydrogenase